MKILKRLMLILASVWSMNLFAAINVNTATVEELQTLNSIGIKKAEAIVAYREAHGPFTKAEDLLNVKGIGKGILEKIRADIEFGTEAIEPAAEMKSEEATQQPEEVKQEAAQTAETPKSS